MDSFPRVVWDDITNIRNWVHRWSTLASQLFADFSWGWGKRDFCIIGLKRLSSTPFFRFCLTNTNMRWVDSTMIRLNLRVHKPTWMFMFCVFWDFFSAEKFYQRKSVQTWKIQVYVIRLCDPLVLRKPIFAPQEIGWLIATGSSPLPSEVPKRSARVDFIDKSW